jgi:hypothetical protein
MSPRTVSSKPQSPVVTTTIQMPEAGETEKPREREQGQDFWGYMNGLSAEQWKDHIVYLTREQPKTTINGVGGYLTKLVQPFDIEDIKAAFGGREFSYIMKRDGKILYSGKFSVEAPPRLDATREGSGNPAPNGNGGGDAATFQKEFISVLREELARSREASNGSAVGQDRVVEMMAKAAERSMEIVKDQIPAAGNAASMLKDTIEMLKTMGLLGQPQQGTSIIDTIRVLKELGLIGAPATAVATDPAAQLNSMLGIFEKLDDLRGGGGGGGGKGNWFSLIEKGLETLPRAVEALGAQRAAAGPPAASRGTRAPVYPAAAPRAAYPPSAPTGAGQPAPTTGGLRTEPLNRTIDQQPEAADVNETLPKMPAEEFDAWVKRNIVEMVYMGVDGGRIANFLYDHKPDTLTELVKYPAPQITQFFGMDPILGKAVKHPNWQAILLQARQAAEEILADEAAEDGAQSVN